MLGNDPVDQRRQSDVCRQLSITCKPRYTEAGVSEVVLVVP